MSVLLYISICTGQYNMQWSIERKRRCMESTEIWGNLNARDSIRIGFNYSRCIAIVAIQILRFRDKIQKQSLVWWWYIRHFYFVHSRFQSTNLAIDTLHENPNNENMWHIFYAIFILFLCKPFFRLNCGLIVGMAIFGFHVRMVAAVSTCRKSGQLWTHRECCSLDGSLWQ